MAFVRLVLVVVWFLFACLVGLLWFPFRWGDLDLDHDLARVFSWGMRGLSGVRVEVEGRERLDAGEPVIYVANHQSAFDLATFGSVCPRRTVVIGKKELRWIPLFGIL